MQFVERNNDETLGTGQRTVHLKFVKRSIQYTMRKNMLNPFDTTFITIVREQRVPLGKPGSSKEGIGREWCQRFDERQFIKIPPDIIGRALMEQQRLIAMYI